jgi:hypothetical protein
MAEGKRQLRTNDLIIEPSRQPYCHSVLSQGTAQVGTILDALDEARVIRQHLQRVTDRQRRPVPVGSTDVSNRRNSSIIGLAAAGLAPGADRVSVPKGVRLRTLRVDGINFLRHVHGIGEVPSHSFRSRCRFAHLTSRRRSTPLSTLGRLVSDGETAKIRAHDGGPAETSQRPSSRSCTPSAFSHVWQEVNLSAHKKLDGLP